MTLTKKVAQNTVVQVLGRLVSTAASLFLVILLTNYLGTSGYGEYTTIFAYVGFFNVFVDFGLYMITVREISKSGADVERIVGNLLTIRTALAFIVFSVASGIAFLMPYSFTIKIGIMLASFAIAFVTIGQTFQSVFQSKLKMHFHVAAEIIGRLSVFTITYLMIKADYGLLYVVLAYIIGDFIQISVQYLFSRRFVKIRPRFDKEIVKKLLVDSIPLGVAGILGMVYFKIDTILLSVLPLKEGLSNMHEVGIYGVSYKILEVLVAFPSMFIGSIFPALSNYIGKNKEKAQRVFERGLNFLVIVAVPLVVGTLVLAPRIIVLISDQSFISASVALRILIFAVAISFIGNLMSHVIISSNLQKKLIYVMLSVGLLNLFLNIILIPLFSYIAAAFVTVISELLVTTLCIRIIFRETELRPNFWVFFKAVLASIFMGIFVWFLDGLFVSFWEAGKSKQLFAILLVTVFSALLYFSLAYLFKAYSKEDLKKIFARG